MSLTFNEVEKVDLQDFKKYLNPHYGVVCLYCTSSKEVTLYLDTYHNILRARCPHHMAEVTTFWKRLDDKDVFILKCLLSNN